jgi:hypothetical protein
MITEKVTVNSLASNAGTKNGVRTRAAFAKLLRKIREKLVTASTGA